MLQIELNIFIGGQINLTDMERLSAMGLRAIVNNRPDHEETGQPPSAAVEAAARSFGMAYTHLPISGGFSAQAVEDAGQAIRTMPVLMFCKLGMRSAALWALARAAEGADPDQLLMAAANVGYDLRMFRPMLGR